MGFLFLSLSFLKAPSLGLPGETQAAAILSTPLYAGLPFLVHVCLWLLRLMGCYIGHKILSWKLWFSKFCRHFSLSSSSSVSVGTLWPNTWGKYPDGGKVCFGPASMVSETPVQQDREDSGQSSSGCRKQRKGENCSLGNTGLMIHFLQQAPPLTFHLLAIMPSECALPSSLTWLSSPLSRAHPSPPRGVPPSSQGFSSLF